MLKFICDSCQKEFTPEFSFTELTTKDRADVLLSPQKGRQQILPQTKISVYHLCLDCRNEIIVGFKPKK